MGFVTTFQIVHHNEYLGRNRDVMLPEEMEAYREVFRKLFEAKRRGEPVGVSYNFLHYMMKWGDFRVVTREEPLMFSECLAGKLYCNVDTDGSVYPCSLLIGKYPALNALAVGFRRAFENLREIPCQSCVATCFTEYNFLYSLDLWTLYDWLVAMKRY